jgi:alanyl-tRNA synthetase
MTDRLYYTDPYLRSFEATVIGREGDRVYLDRTAFYPTSGGQPFDVGKLGGVEVIEVVDEDDRIAHKLAGPLGGDRVTGEIDWTRRWDHMQQHTGQHLLSAVLIDLYNWPTLSFHMGADYSTIEIQAASVTDAQIAEAEERANHIVWENRPVAVSFEDAASGDLGLRKESKREGILRIVSIDRLDRSACGGTHVRSTGEIGWIQLRKMEKIRGNTRIEFQCGFRALRRARADYRALAQIARTLSAPIDETPPIVEAKIAEAAESEKARKKLSLDVASMEGKQLYAATAPGSDGVRRYRFDGALTEEVRARATAFIASERAVFLAVCNEPASLLYAVSPDVGINAGQVVKDALAANGGRGGGNPQMAQGSVKDRAALDAVVVRLESLGR